MRSRSVTKQDIHKKGKKINGAKLIFRVPRGSAEKRQGCKGTEYMREQAFHCFLTFLSVSVAQAWLLL